LAEKREGTEVAVIDERETITYPKPETPAYTMIVTYRADSPVPRTVFIGLSDIAKGKEEELRKQIHDKKGDLYKVYLAHRIKRIREDIEQAAAFKPETLRI